MERFGGRKRRMMRWLLGVSVLLLAAACAIAAFAFIDFERYRSDADRVKRLAAADLPVAAAQAARTDWPQWRGPSRDGVSLETGLLDEWPAAGPPVLWKKSIGRGFSSFAIASDRLYTMEQEAAGTTGAGIFECILCLDVRTGNEVWRYRYPSHFDERFGPGPRSTPAVDGESVYAVGPTGIMHCLRAGTGEKIWRRDLLDEFQGRPMQYGVAFSPLVDGDHVYVSPGGPAGNSVAALDKSTGRLAWKSHDDPASYSSPIAATLAGSRQILFLTNTELVSFSADGAALWHYPWKTEDGFNIASPIAFGNYVFISSGYGKGCALLEVTVAPDGSPKVGRVYEHNRMRPYFASPVRLGEFLYGFDQTDLVCMNVRSGAIIWREKGLRDVRKGSLLAADGHLIILGESGTLSLVRATPDCYQEKSICRISQTRCWTCPALADGKLFVRDDAQIICFDLRNQRDN
jgi:outer membrane protein assembly factor BamB